MDDSERKEESECRSAVLCSDCVDTYCPYHPVND